MAKIHVNNSDYSEEEMYQDLMEKIHVNNSDYMEFIDDIATQITIQRFGEDTYAPSSEVGQEHVMMFQEDAQDFYNEQYDWVETMLNRTLKVYSDEQ